MISALQAVDVTAGAGVGPSLWYLGASMSGSDPRRIRRSLAGLVCLLLLLGVAAVDAPPAAASDPLDAPDAVLYFPQTGQVVTGPFLDYWQAHPEIGMPVSPHVQVGLHLTQWFEYARVELRWVGMAEATVDDIYPVELGPERFFPDTGHSVTSGFRAYYEQPGVAERLGPPISEEFVVRGVVHQFFQFGALRWDAASGAQLVQLGRLDAWLNRQLGRPQPIPPGAINADTSGIAPYSAQLSGERWIEVDLSDYTVTAWVGNVAVLREQVVVGSPYSPTVQGTFHISTKVRMQDMSGIGWNGEPYFEANIPWVMYFYEDYAFHGTTWRTTFGIADGQGCVVMPNHVAQFLWEFAETGTRVWVHG
ncbi:MAG: hypothetical protein DCC58_19505 [Chloroflexi bacterium]|nr:MAG: hypothetical protein DCC58_19505 [Chloroflexota bacterium]